MVTLSSLLLADKAHWELHLKAALKDNPSMKEQIDVFLIGSELPNIKHPSYVHDWLEYKRVEIEALNG